ncbi:MAG: elongation factor P [Verrucomicrobia bacterium]|nr:elongation factor P [Verrucomicrobiota bacterium]MBS0636153.1 elongation factor P [Verrucomicrobiota bacterium]
MVTSAQLAPGMTVSIAGKLYRVESSVKVTVPKGSPFIKTKLRDLESSQVTEKNFKPNQEVEEVVLQERRLEYLYPEGKQFLFLDIGNLEQVMVPKAIIGNKVNYLKEGIEIKAEMFKSTIFAVLLPQFLELMVIGIDTGPSIRGSTASKVAELETGARIEVPPFIEVGDIIKVDTESEEYIQRV